MANVVNPRKTNLSLTDLEMRLVILSVWGYEDSNRDKCVENSLMKKLGKACEGRTDLHELWSEYLDADEEKTDDEDVEVNNY